MDDCIQAVYETILERRDHPAENSYTRYLFDQGIDKILKKVGEECAETIIAAKNPGTEELVGELADLMYHLSVLLAEKGLDWTPVFAELERRELTEGNLKEKKHPEQIADY